MRTHSISPDRFIPDHFLISETDGNLYDIRPEGWHNLPPLRKAFRMHKRAIESVHDLKAAMRAGKRIWPGGHTAYFITSDGSVLSYEAVFENFTEVVEALNSANHSGWHVVSLASTENDEEPAVCDHTGKEIE